MYQNKIMFAGLSGKWKKSELQAKHEYRLSLKD